MLDFPLTLHDIEKFHVEDCYYVVDLNQNTIHLIDRVVYDVLELCSSYNQEEIINCLTKQYSETHIFKAFETIEQLAEAGRLVSYTSSNTPISNEKLRVLVFIDRLPLLEHKSGATILNDYFLLRTLSRDLDVTICLDETLVDTFESNENNFTFIPREKELIHAPTHHINLNYNATIAFSSGILTNLPIFCWNNVPAIVRIHSGEKSEDTLINSILAAHTVKRPFDAIVVDAPWIINRCREILSSDLDLHLLFDSVDLDRFKPSESLMAKQYIGEIAGDPKISTKTVVGIITGNNPEVGYHIGQSMAQLRREFFFIVFAPGLPDNFLADLPENLLFHTTDEDLDADIHLTPTLLNAMDVCFFHATLQNSSSLLLQTLACGVPTVIGTDYPLPDFEGTCAFIHSGYSITSHQYLDLLCSALDQILSNPSDMERFSHEGRRFTANLSDDAITKKFINLVHSLGQQRFKKRKMPVFPIFPSLFTSSCHPAYGTVQSHTLRFPSCSIESVEKGLAKELLQSHTLQEVELLLTEICDNGRAEANQILASLSGLFH